MYKIHGIIAIICEKVVTVSPLEKTENKYKDSSSDITDSKLLDQKPDLQKSRLVFFTFMVRVLCFVSQSCLTLCNPMGCSPPGSSVHGDLLGENTGVGCHALIQEIVPTQGLNQVFPAAGGSFTV